MYALYWNVSSLPNMSPLQGHIRTQGPSLWWLHVGWISNYLCNECLSSLTLGVRILIMARCTRYNIMLKRLSLICTRSIGFSGTLVFYINKAVSPRYSWNIFESGVKHYNLNPNTYQMTTNLAQKNKYMCVHIQQRAKKNKQVHHCNWMTVVKIHNIKQEPYKQAKYSK